MKFRYGVGLLLIAVVCCAAARAIAAESGAEHTLLDFRQVDLARAEMHDVKASLLPADSVLPLRLAAGHRQPWPGINFPAPQGTWDLSAFDHVTVEIRNAGTAPCRAICRLDTPGGNRDKCFIQGTEELSPGETKTVRVRLTRRLPAALAGKLFGMRGYPGGVVEEQTGAAFDSARVNYLRISLAKPTADHVLEVGNVRVGGRAPAPLPADPRQLFPMIDRYGQYMHSDWPGKVHNDAELAARLQGETADLAAHPGPDGWDRYGGWLAGPQFQASGFFRCEKYGGKWWLVDPDGWLFWSLGPDGVRPDNCVTPITDRKHWFAELPAAGSQFAQFFGKGAWAPHGYYMGKQYETYCFSAADLLRKYGPDWRQRFAPLAHQRLRSWGMNTVANWSAPEVYLVRRTPYVVSISARHKELQGSSGYWGKFADVFDPSFRAGLCRRMKQEEGKSAGDPWCLGYFVDNELGWGDETSLAVSALASPAGQAAKSVFIEQLKKKYADIGALNHAWGTKHASWDALAESRTPPDTKLAFADLAAFYTATAEQYFRTCREAVKEVAPNNLYLGCRFAWVNDRAVRAAVKYCDVVSYNRYRDTVDDLQLPDGGDRPVIIGEFHFGALDRGLFHTGLRPVENQAERAQAFQRYLRSALGNPLIVGAHWFEYCDEATTGRGDGENFQIGLVDVCDTPYVEMVQAAREIGAALYTLRAKEKSPKPE